MLRNHGLLLGLLFVSTAAFAAADKCPVTVDKMKCTISYKNTAGTVDNQYADFPVYSSTFLCDGQSNKYFHQEFPVSPEFVATIYASWDALRLSVYRASDAQRVDPVADLHTARAAGDATESNQSLYTKIAPDQYVQIMCSTIERGK